jgi:AbrB family looped-hinge helix DNA binding protein
MTNKNLEQTIIASRIGQRRQVVIPKRVFDALKLREGDYMEVTTQEGRIHMRPKRLINLEDTLTKTEAAAIRRGEAQIKVGRSKAWSVVKHGVER